MSPKIYLIKNPKGQFLNVEQKEPFFSNNLSLGSYGTKRTHVQRIIDSMHIGVKLEIHESTELEFTQDLATKTTSVIIKLDSIQVELDMLGYNLPTISALNKNLSNFIKNTSKKLKEVNPGFKEFVKHQEDSTYEVVGVYEEFINEVSLVGMWECSELASILKARRLDRKSILGVTNKILNNKK